MTAPKWTVLNSSVNAKFPHNVIIITRGVLTLTSRSYIPTCNSSCSKSELLASVAMVTL